MVCRLVHLDELTCEDSFTTKVGKVFAYCRENSLPLLDEVALLHRTLISANA